jgi:hypothetical protein
MLSTRLSCVPSIVSGLLLLLVAGCTSSDSITPYVLQGRQSYTLSASVSGLSGSGLVLSVDGANVEVPPGTTVQQLTVALPAGLQYSVLVASQPTGETCSVAGGEGTIGSANVANVVVTCAQTAYALGGTVAGLSVSGLVLANGTDMVAVPAGGTSFTLPAEVAVGSSYDVTVKAQPAGLACAVSAGLGTMPASSVTSVRVSCTDQPFTLGGTVTNSPGITVANGSDTVSVPSGSGSSSFTLPQAVAFGSSYDVTVQNVPAGRACTVTNGSGLMGASNVTNVAITCSTDTYSVGGSLSGLSAGDTLVIANSNGDHTTIDPTQSTYTMNEPVAYGASYALTVLTQPTGKTCVIANASGTNVTANVTNANLSCAATLYTIGGTITGLNAATGLVLQNNGGDNTAISANATTFSMTTGVPANALYSITVLTQPTPSSVANATATISCTVSNGGGTTPNGNITSVLINCTNTVTFATAGGPYTWTVPSGVTSVNVVATGAGGGGAGGIGTAIGFLFTSGSGGWGGTVIAPLTVTAGESLTVTVGGGGGGGEGGESGGYYGAGGGGGGASSVNPGSATQLIAGGGGGGGGQTANSAGGNGDGSNASAGGGPGTGGGGRGGGDGTGGSGGVITNHPASAGGNGFGGPGGTGANNSIIIGGAAGSGNGSGSGGAGLWTGGGGGGGYGGGGGGEQGGGGGGGSTGPVGSTVQTATDPTGPGAAGASGTGGSDGSPGADGSIVITY